MLYLSESMHDSVTADEVVNPASDSREETPAEPSEQSQTALTSESEALQKESVFGLLVEPVATQCGSTASAAVETLMQQPAKLKKDKLARLRELGLDPPPVAKLCPDDGAFVQLEPPQLNPGESCFFQDFKRGRIRTCQKSE